MTSFTEEFVPVASQERIQREVPCRGILLVLMAQTVRIGSEALALYAQAVDRCAASARMAESSRQIERISLITWDAALWIASCPCSAPRSTSFGS